MNKKKTESTTEFKKRTHVNFVETRHFKTVGKPACINGGM